MKNWYLKVIQRLCLASSAVCFDNESLRNSQLFIFTVVKNFETPMDKDSAIKIAKAHIDKMNNENPYSKEMVWILKEPIEVHKGFYFDYSFDLMNPDYPIALGGAPGFIVSSSDNKLIDISWEEYRKLQISQ